MTREDFNVDSQVGAHISASEGCQLVMNGHAVGRRPIPVPWDYEFSIGDGGTVNWLLVSERSALAQREVLENPDIGPGIVISVS